MGLFSRARYGVLYGVGCVGFSVGLTSVAAAQGVHRPTKHAVELTPWEQAQQARAEFEAEPAGAHGTGARGKAAYGRVLDQYRAIYHDNPGDLHAPEAVSTVAELLAEQGRELNDPASLRSAVGQYEFLRSQYPESSLRAAALLAEGRIEEQDLKDPATAREKYAAVVKEAPKSRAGGEARLAMAELKLTLHGAGVNARSEPGTPREAKRTPKAEPPVDGLALTEANARRLEASAAPPAKPPTTDNPAATRPSRQPGVLAGAEPARPATGGTSEPAPLTVPPRSAKSGTSSAKQAANSSRLAEKAIPSTESLNATPEARPVTGPGARPARRTGGLAQVTGIRHWSTATYTRVAIDLGDEITFEAARVPNPDRIYFDLHGAKLGADLVGRSFNVTDDGFLKKIRAAQAGGDVTRVVLDVNDVTEYSAFLLPNPYRLIIDIHGGLKAPASAHTVEPAPQLPVADADPARASAAANSSGLPATAPTDIGPVPKTSAAASAANQNGRVIGSSSVAAPAPMPDARHGSSAEPVHEAAAARPVPNTVTERAPATTTEVAAVSDAPGRVVATNAPTSKPVAATVPVNLGSGAGPTASATAASRRKRPLKNPDSAVAGDTAAPAKAADHTADGETSMIRALGLKIGRIVIDAGHGGHDSGTLGVDGIEEKDVVLDVALRLGKLLHERLGAEIIYTRSDDTFIPLETRTAIANKAQADLFLSVHANSSEDPTARGVETYYLNFTSDATALDVAARENAVSGQSIHQLSDLVKKITLKDKIAESREFASDVEGSLYSGLAHGNEGLKNRGVKKAPFVVLIGANMPSILAEISFVTNPRDASQLRQPDYRERVAESLYAGVAKYESGLAGSRSTSAPVVRASRGE